MWKFVSIIFLLLLVESLAAQPNNPFNVIRSENQQILTDTISPELQEDITKIEGENPFDISHLPIRKNQYKEIEKLTVREESSKETISIAYKPLWSIILSLCILAFIIFIKKDHIISLIKSLFNENYLRLMDYESNGGKNQIYILGYILFLSNLTLFIYLYLTRELDVNMNYIYIRLMVASLIFFIGKHILLNFIAYVFNVEKESHLYNFKLISDYNVLGIIFLILNILIIFGPEIWLKTIGIAGLTIFFLFVITRYYRGIHIAKKYFGQNFFHFFIYFCAFEFSPWVIVYTLVKNLI